MNLLIVLTLASKTGAYGGPFDTAAQQAQIAAESEVKVELIAGSFVGDAPVHQKRIYRQTYIPVRKISPRGKFVTAISIAMVAELWKAVGRSNVVHVSFSREIIPLIAAVFSVIRRRRLILQPHGMLTSRTSPFHKIVDVGVRALYARAVTIIALTDREKSQLTSWSPRVNANIVTIGNPVPQHGKARLRELGAQVNIAFIARLHPRKNVGTFLEAASLMTEQTNIGFTVVGPDEGDAPKVRVALKNLTNLRYLGAVDAQQVVEVLDSSDVFVLTSYREPWGNVLAMALSMGIPVVVSESSALSAVISKYQAGLVIPDDNTGMLVAALNQMIANPQRYAEFSSNALQLSAEVLDQQNQKNLLTQIYEGN